MKAAFKNFQLLADPELYEAMLKKYGAQSYGENKMAIKTNNSFASWMIAEKVGDKYKITPISSQNNERQSLQMEAYWTTLKEFPITEYKDVPIFYRQWFVNRGLMDKTENKMNEIMSSRQKFSIGDKVMIVKGTNKGKKGKIVDTYYNKYGGGQDKKNQFTLYLYDEKQRVSWFMPTQLRPLEEVKEEFVNCGLIKESSASEEAKKKHINESKDKVKQTLKLEFANIFYDVFGAQSSQLRKFYYNEFQKSLKTLSETERNKYREIRNELYKLKPNDVKKKLEKMLGYSAFNDPNDPMNESNAVNEATDIKIGDAYKKDNRIEIIIRRFRGEKWDTIEWDTKWNEIMAAGTSPEHLIDGKKINLPSSLKKKIVIAATKEMKNPNNYLDDVGGLDAIKSALKEEADRDYKDEYKKFQSSEKSKKYRAELNKYNRDKGTYGNGDGKDATHKDGKIRGFEDESKNKGRREKSRLKKESKMITKTRLREIIIEEYQKLNEGNIVDDGKEFIKDLQHNGIIKHGKMWSTGSGAKGKYKIPVSTGGVSFTNVNDKIEKKYKKTGQTELSSSVYYSPKRKLYFYFYPEKDRSYSFELDKFIEYDFVFLIRRKTLKGE
jgi:hypothetical protein